MGSYILLAMTRPVDGKESDFNEWYNDYHTADLLDIPGIISAQRFKLRNEMGFDHKNNYLAIYKIETDDLDAVLKDMSDRIAASSMVTTDSLDMGSTLSGVYEVLTPVIHKGDPDK